MLPREARARKLSPCREADLVPPAGDRTRCPRRNLSELRSERRATRLARAIEIRQPGLSVMVTWRSPSGVCPRRALPRRRQPVDPTGSEGQQPEASAPPADRSGLALPNIDLSELRTERCAERLALQRCSRGHRTLACETRAVQAKLRAAGAARQLRRGRRGATSDPATDSLMYEYVKTVRRGAAAPHTITQCVHGTPMATPRVNSTWLLSTCASNA
jgi:hypothetical protein